MLGKRATEVIVGALGLIAAHCAVAGKTHHKEPGIDRTPVRCIWLPQLKNVTPVDSKTVLFYMRDGDVYRNTLHDKCFGLNRSAGIAYQTSMMQLCRADTITPFDLQVAIPRLPCRLGRFVPIDRLEAKDMLAGPKDALALQNEVQVKEIKLPPDDSSATTHAAPSAPGADTAPASGRDAKAPPSGAAADQPD